jgi:hypothetical protein
VNQVPEDSDEATRLRAEIVELHRQLLARDEAYRDPEGYIKQLEAEKAELREAHAALLTTRGWRTVEAIRALRDRILFRR